MFRRLVARGQHDLEVIIVQSSSLQYEQLHQGLKHTSTKTGQVGGGHAGSTGKGLGAETKGGLMMRATT